MDDLQKARAAWIAALEENQRLSIDRDRLRRENHELRMNLASARCQATIMEGLASAYAKTLFLGS